MPPSLTEELAGAAARLVVEEGLEYGPAKRKALRVLGKHSVRPAELPSNELVEDEVRSYLALFCADTQPGELRGLRELALQWMQRLAEFRPHLAGAAWRGTATRLSNLHLDLYCDDPKAAEIELINRGIDFDLAAGGSGSEHDVLALNVPCRAARRGAGGAAGGDAAGAQAIREAGGLALHLQPRRHRRGAHGRR
jgi:hypothetical protein